MSWLTPLGFLGLIGLIILIIIYIIKPNYQQKIISSTFVWKLSLRYRKKKIPINKFRNILIFLCQVLIISLCSAILATPSVKADEQGKYAEKIAIIDASASMWTTLGNETRFERAVDGAIKLAEEAAFNDSMITVILANEKATFLVQRSGAENLFDVKADLNELIKKNDIKCSYGEADVEGAMKLAEVVLEENPNAEVVFFTDKEYYDDGEVRVEDVSDIAEWNAAILDVRVTLEENYYKIAIDVACYGKPSSVPLYVDIYDANIEKKDIALEKHLQLMMDEVQTVEYYTNPDDPNDPNAISVYMYDYIYIHLGVDDNYSIDNKYYVYGGTRPSIKVQYYSTTPNNFYYGMLGAWRNTVRARWDVEIDEVKDIYQNFQNNPEMSGYDIYIFENKMPASIPTDGIVILVNPDKAPVGSGINLVNSWPITYQAGVELEGDVTHPAMKGITPSNIKVMQHANISENGSDNYTTLMSCSGRPVVMVKNEPMEKIAVIGFSTKWATWGINYDFPMMFYNILEYFMPSTLSDYAFDVNETIQLNARGPELEISSPNGKTEKFETFPAEIKLSTPGAYTLTQVPLSGVEMVENFYVTTPAKESDISGKEDKLKNPYFGEREEAPDFDPILYFAAALVALLFLEWWLQSRE